ncbi:short neuropeptide F [Anabrus simplex]|uniref:short neuropeptide F n=1 Tax=Anabrus simplex TaxID=316456 RepID=UPI0034DD2DD6
MSRLPTVTCCCLVLSLLLLVAHGAPSYSDYENVRDLYELLLQKEALEGRLTQPQGTHEIVRKSNRSPSLRLRFGRRADPFFARSSFSEHSPVEGPVEN